jgi:molybdopterin converting factor small subunit
VPVNDPQPRPSRAAPSIKVKLLAFARLRELLGTPEREVVLPATATLDDLWRTIETPQLAPLRGSTRFARNGVVVDPGTALAEGDEIALLPPVGGG